MKAVTTQADESVIVGGRFVAGFLVVADESLIATKRRQPSRVGVCIKPSQSTSLGNELRLNALQIARVFL